MEIQNAQITEVDLGTEDHGQLGVCITFSGEGWGQGFGWYGFGRINTPITDPYGIEFIRRILTTFEVNDWSKLKGIYARIKRDEPDGPIRAIGHITKEKWFEPREVWKK